MTSVYADFKHGLALWAGDSDVQEHYEAVGRKCKQHGADEDFEKHIRVLHCPEDVNEVEMAQMKRTLRIPRRVSIRHAKGAFDAADS